MDSVTLIKGVFVLIVLCSLQIWILARIFGKAGYSGWLGLLGLLLGLGTFIALLILAFGDWPAYRQQGTFTANAGT